jgi:hypothetical protein
MSTTALRPQRLPSIREAAPLADRVLYSTAAPTIALPAPYEYVTEPYPTDPDIDRYVVYYAPAAEHGDRADYDSVREFFVARRTARERAAHLRTKVGSVETRIGKLGVWVGFRPDRRLADGFSREIGEWGHANLAIREIVRLDRRSR